MFRLRWGQLDSAGRRWALVLRASSADAHSARPGPGGTECHYCTLPKEVMARLSHAAAPDDQAAGA